jgi:hypothetical protein
MVESRWFRRAGPGIAAIGALGVIASSVAGGPRSFAAELPACAGPIRPGAPADAWYRLDPMVTAGTLTGQRLAVGRLARDGQDQLSLGAESFVAGPFDGRVLVGTDDGGASRVALIDAVARCRWDIAREGTVIRAATVSPDRRWIVEARVDRVTRTDLGVWRRSLEPDGPAPVRVLPPVDPDARFGRTWLTDLAWTDDGRLVAGSCGEVACRFRVLDLSTRRIRSVADPRLGWLIGVADGRLVSHAACRGLPCPILVTDLDTGSVAGLATGSGAAVLAIAPDGTPLTVAERSPGDPSLDLIELDGHVAGHLRLDGARGRLVAGSTWSRSSVEHDPDRIVVAPDGRVPAGGRDVGFRRIPDGVAVSQQEGSR